MCTSYGRSVGEGLWASLSLTLRAKEGGAGKGRQAGERRGQDEHRETRRPGRNGLGSRRARPHGGGAGEDGRAGTTAGPVPSFGEGPAVLYTRRAQERRRPWREKTGRRVGAGTVLAGREHGNRSERHKAVGLTAHKVTCQITLHPNPSRYMGRLQTAPEQAHGELCSVGASEPSLLSRARE